jgi:hypothetical protein
MTPAISRYKQYVLNTWSYPAILKFRPRKIPERQPKKLKMSGKIRHTVKYSTVALAG